MSRIPRQSNKSTPIFNGNKIHSAKPFSDIKKRGSEHQRLRFLSHSY